MKISIKECLNTYGSGLQKTWEHDRLNTVGASEVGACIRKTWFSKNETPADPDYEDRFGAKLRGDIIERHYWVPGLRSALPDGVSLVLAGDDQRTFVDGYLSATSDGLLLGVRPDALAHLDIDDIGADCLVVEAKSIDPRVDIRVEKPEHSFQVQAQIGLIRFATEHRPNYALISYVDASFLDDVREFAIPFDQRIYDTAKERARRVFTTDSALELPPEGKMSGGGECKYCPYASRCAAVTVAGIPSADDVKLGDNAAAELKRLRDAERVLAAQKDATETEHATAREAVKEFLRTNGIRRYTGEGWGVSWSSIKGRETVDTKAAEAAGIDLSTFKKVGDPADRLVVK